MNYLQWLRSKVGHDPVILVGVGGVIHDGRGNILLQRRGGFTPATWSCSGGLLELGETAHEALVREVHEETGLHIAIEEFLGGYTNRDLVTYPNGDQAHVISFMFVCSVIGGEAHADGDETLELGWFSKDTLPLLFSIHTQPIQDYYDGVRGIIR